MPDLSGLTDEQRLRIGTLVTEISKAAPKYRHYTYTPYEWQKAYHEAGKEHTERMLMAANRCISPWTVVETVPRPRRIAEVLGETRFYVRSWADGSECIAQASGAFLKGIEPAFRFHLDNGEFFDCSRKHRILTCEGWLSADQIVRRSSGLRWTQTRADYLASCGADGRQDDVQLLLAAGSDLEPPPSQGGVRQRGLVFERSDAAERISRCSRAYPDRDRFAIEDDPQRIAVLCAQFQDPAPYIGVLHRSGTHQELLQCASESGRAPADHEGALRQSSSGLFSGATNECRASGNRLVAEGATAQEELPSVSRFGHGQGCLESPHDAPHITIFYPSDHPALVGENRIISVVPLGYQPILDFTVDGTHCYRAGGAVHHNTGKTMSAGAETAYHLTGEYPDWWEGRRFDRPVLVWTGSPTNETSKDIVQNELLGGLGEDLGTGWIPENRIVGKPTTRQAGVRNVVDSFQVRHRSGGNSTCILKTYEQGWRKWQGTAPHVVWLDEEPEDYMIYSEAQTRVLTSSGIIMVTFTPLLGVTDLVEHFMEGGDGIYLKTATWDDAPHLGVTERERLISSYRAHERDARTKGIPMMGKGAIFPIRDENIMCKPFEVPPYYARLKGCDFGYEHPAAGVEIAYDRDQDIVYVIDCYKKDGQLAPYHAAWFTKANPLIPVSWPHDGLNTEKSGGGTIKDAYMRHGVNMLSKSARYPKSYGVDEKAGAQPQWPVIDEIRERMETGRFRVFSHLSEWFDEKRSFHVKEGPDGQPRIVNRRDDILKATFYAVMMKRFAVPLTALNAPTNRAPQTPIASARL